VTGVADAGAAWVKLALLDHGITADEEFRAWFAQALQIRHHHHRPPQWDPAVFERIAPGRAADYGHDKILLALEQLRDVIGDYRAHSILIAGLEPAASSRARTGSSRCAAG
jgi:hypothetical protein